MNCKHEQSMLMGTADGIVCKSCGRTFESFAELLLDREGSGKPEAAPAEPEAAPKKRTRKKN